jgi:hypothetical protein
MDDLMIARLALIAGLWLLLLSLQACDFVGGLIRVADLEGTLDEPCVMKALEAVDGVVGVRHSEDRYGYHRFDYSVSGIENKLIYEVVSADEVRYWNDYSLLNTIPALGDIETIWPYLYEIDRNIEIACDVDISGFLIEGCNRIDCG